jgi:hypothetical protein
LKITGTADERGRVLYRYSKALKKTPQTIVASARVGRVLRVAFLLVRHSSGKHDTPAGSRCTSYGPFN